jgi:hypothetical protein
MQNHELNYSTLIVDLAISICVCSLNHFFDFLVGQLLSETRHHMSEFVGADEAIAIAIKRLKSDEQSFSRKQIH